MKRKSSSRHANLKWASKFSFSIFLIACVAMTAARPLPAQNVEVNRAASERTVLEPTEIYQRTMMSTVLIVTEESLGTGWILNKAERQLITNQHVIEGAKEVRVFFPKFRNGELVTDLREYEENEGFSATVMDESWSKDLAMLTVHTIPSQYQELPLASRSARPAERVHTVGGLPQGTNGLFVYSNGYVRQNSFGMYANLGEGLILEMTVPINPGNSGGPIVNDFGEVVGVAEGVGTNVVNVSLAVDISELKSYLNEVRLISNATTPEDRLNLGIRFFESGSYARASSILESAVSDGIGDAGIANRLGRCYYFMGKFQLAAVAFGKAIDGNDRISGYHTNLGDALQELGHNRLAIASFDKAIEINAYDDRAFFLRGYSHQLMENHKKAIVDFERAIELNNENEYYRFALQDSAAVVGRETR